MCIFLAIKIAHHNKEISQCMFEVLDRRRRGSEEGTLTLAASRTVGYIASFFFFFAFFSRHHVTVDKNLLLGLVLSNRCATFQRWMVLEDPHLATMFGWTQGFSFLPIFLVIWSSATFIVSYLIAICRNDVDVIFPYIRYDFIQTFEAIKRIPKFRALIPTRVRTNFSFVFFDTLAPTPGTVYKGSIVVFPLKYNYFYLTICTGKAVTENTVEPTIRVPVI